MSTNTRSRSNDTFIDLDLDLDLDNVGANITAQAATGSGVEFYNSSGEVERLSNFCVDFPSAIKQQAYHTLQEFLETDGFKDVKLSDAECFSCIVFIAIKTLRMPYVPSDAHLREQSLTPPTMTITDLLEHAKLNINNLFGAMHMFRDQVSVSTAILQHLTSMERNYCVVSALFHTFQTRLCSKVFREECKSELEGSTLLPPMPETEGVSFRKKQCWLLFLLAKYHLMADNQELVQHFQLMLCCVEFVLRQTPSFLLNNPYDSVKFEALNAQNREACLLTQLASDFELPAEETFELRNKKTEDFFQTLLSCDGELELDRLQGEYEMVYKVEGDINEVLYLDEDPHLQTQNIANGGSGSGSSSPEVGQLWDQVHNHRMTPVRSAVNSIQQLLQSVSEVSDKASPWLVQFFQKCSPDPSAAIAKHIAKMRKDFVVAYNGTYKQNAGSTVGEHRFTMGLKLYYKVLQTMLEKEAESPPSDMLSGLLNKMMFHTALLACALEVVLTTYGQSWNYESGLMTTDANKSGFPWVLGVLSLQAYEFYKVVSSFIKYEPQLPQDVIKHLQAVEFRILDSDAWKEASSLYDILVREDPGMLSQPNGSPAKNSADSACSPCRSASETQSPLQLFSSPVCNRYPRETSPVHLETEAQDLSSPNRAVTLKSQSLSYFLSKVCKLAFTRLSRLCNCLQISKDMQHKIWTCFEYVVMKVSYMVKNRHIDQIIMCSIFAICKVNEKDVTFKSIVAEYRNLPYAKQEIYKNVYLSSDEGDSIIMFYNKIFMPDLKRYIFQYSPNASLKPQLSPMPKQTNPSPSYSLPGKKNFLVSPLKEGFEFKTPASPSQMTPSTRLLYSFGDSIGSVSAEKLRHINQRMSARGRESAKKKLNLDDLGMAPNTKAKKLVL